MQVLVRVKGRLGFTNHQGCTNRSGHTRWSLTAGHGNRFYLPEKEQLLQDISKFEDRGDVYQRHGGSQSDTLGRRYLICELGIPWRRGYLLHGPPGTGKTSLVKALAGHRKCPLYIVNLGDDVCHD